MEASELHDGCGIWGNVAEDAEVVAEVAQSLWGFWRLAAG